MNMQIGDKFLITTAAWFFAPDGRMYRAVFGTVKAISSDEGTLGIKTNERSTNWYVVIGNMVVAGCQVNYAVRCDQCNTGQVCEQHIDKRGHVRVSQRMSSIYDADGAA